MEMSFSNDNIDYRTPRIGNIVKDRKNTRIEYFVISHYSEFAELSDPLCIFLYIWIASYHYRRITNGRKQSNREEYNNRFKALSIGSFGDTQRRKVGAVDTFYSTLINDKYNCASLIKRKSPRMTILR